MGMGIATWEWEGMGFKNPFPQTSSRILPGFSRLYATGAHRLREQWRWHGSTFLNIGYSKA